MLGSFERPIETRNIELKGEKEINTHIFSFYLLILLDIELITNRMRSARNSHCLKVLRELS